MSTLREALHGIITRIGTFFFRYRNLVFPVLFLALAIGTRPRIPQGRVRLDHIIDALGIGVILTGQTLRALVIGFAYIKRGGKNRRIYAEALVQEGFFAHSRNPLYLGNIFILVGLIVIHNSTAFYVIGLPFFLFAYYSIVLAEEDFLRDNFGDAYEAYCQRVNRFLPSLRGIRKTLGGMPFDWRRLIRKEYGSTFLWITCVLALLIWEALTNFGYSAKRTEILILAELWIPLFIAYLVVRVLKKKRVLGWE